MKSWNLQRLMVNLTHRCPNFTSSTDFFISSIGTAPPHMRWTYSGVIRLGSIEQDLPSFSINALKRATISLFVFIFILFCVSFYAFNNIFHILIAYPRAARQAKACPEKILAHTVDVSRRVLVNRLHVHGFP